MDISAVATVAVSLFIILDPFASLPVFLSVTKDSDEKVRRSYADKAVLVSAILLIVFTIAGPSLMDLFGVTMDSFRVAGGIMLFLMAVQLVFDLNPEGGDEKGAPWVIVACPILTGPGSITQAIIFSDDYGVATVIVAAVMALAATWVLLRLSGPIMRMVGDQTVGVFSRIIGLMVGAMGVEYIFQGSFAWYSAYANVISIMTP